MQVIPLAIGQSDQTLVLWDEYPEIGVACPRSMQMISQLQFGAGKLDEEVCLVLYLFLAEQVIEIYLPQMLCTTPQCEINVWSILWRYKLELLKLRYGETPVDSTHEVVFLLPKSSGESLTEKFQEFVMKMREQLTLQTADDSLQQLANQLELLTVHE